MIHNMSDNHFTLNPLHYFYIAAIIFLAVFIFIAGVSLDEKKFNSILDNIETSYQPTFKDQNIEFKIVRKWDSPKDNIYAYKLTATKWEIIIHGGFYRHPKININGFIIGVCHEIGHLLGPLESYYRYASERSSDQYSMSGCAVKFIRRPSEIISGVDSIYNWYRDYPVLPGYPSADERRTIMTSELKKILSKN